VAWLLKGLGAPLSRLCLRWPRWSGQSWREIRWPYPYVGVAVYARVRSGWAIGLA